MVEQYGVVDHKTIEYEGLLDIKEFYKSIDEWFAQQGYDKVEKMTSESVTEEGKHIELDIAPILGFTDYAQSLMDIKLIFDGVKEVEIEVDGEKRRMSQCKAIIIIDAFLQTDYEGRWEEKPAMMIIRTFFDKFFLRSETGKYKKHIADDVNRFATFVTTFLNLYKYKK
ncbi:hypothetical protein ACFL1H_07050 [Nanoarchaeota archaeon]